MIKNLASRVREYWTQTILTPLFMIGEVLMETLIPYFMADLVDKGINAGDMGEIKRIGIKLAIKYGKLYYLENHYVNGQLDIEWRKRAIDDIIHTYQHPVSREEHLASLKELRRGLAQANMDGLIAVNGNPSLSSYEAEQYDKALSSLDYLIAAVKYHPILWRIVFQQPS